MKKKRYLILIHKETFSKKMFVKNLFDVYYKPVIVYFSEAWSSPSYSRERHLLRANQASAIVYFLFENKTQKIQTFCVTNKIGFPQGSLCFVYFYDYFTRFLTKRKKSRLGKIFFLFFRPTGKFVMGVSHGRLTE